MHACIPSASSKIKIGKKFSFLDISRTQGNHRRSASRPEPYDDACVHVTERLAVRAEYQLRCGTEDKVAAVHATRSHLYVAMYTSCFCIPKRGVADCTKQAMTLDPRPSYTHESA